MSVAKVALFQVRFSHLDLTVLTTIFYALTVEKQQIYKLTSWHRVPKCELVDLLFLKKISKMCASLYECLLNPRSAIFEEKRRKKKKKKKHFLDGGPQPKICNFGVDLT